jgi:PilZ domain
MDANGKAFFQHVHLSDVSSDGAMLSGVESQLNQGDIIGVQFAEKKVRCSVVRIADGGFPQRSNVEVRLVAGQDCPWKELIPQSASAATPAAPSGRDKRRFVRHKVHFPIEIREEHGGGTPMQTAATDISGRGCYVEMLIPFPLGRVLNVSFWLESEKIHTPAIVRASDPGVGMGIEFTALAEATQERLQQELEKLDDNRLGPKNPVKEP